MPDLKLARLADDLSWLAGRASRFMLIEDDPHLDAHPSLLAELRSRFEASIDWLFRPERGGTASAEGRAPG
jgi:hypothetical protein